MTSQNKKRPQISKHRLATIFILVLMASAIGLAGCSVYFNTFFNAKKAFNRAESVRVKSRTGTGGGGEYKKAIEKALKVVENHPNSKYYDDALYILGVSYFHTRQFDRAERRFRELVANYPEFKHAKDINVYLAKSKLELGEIENAMEAFGVVFSSDYDQKFKAEAALALGDYHFDQDDYKESRLYYLAVRDSLGEGVAKLYAQLQIADGYYESFAFKDALGAYLQAYGMDPDDRSRYQCLYRAARCSYQLQRIDDGLAYLNQLVEDERYYDSLAVLKLTIGEGYEYDDDLIQAEAMYADVAETSENRKRESLANYRLGLIYQFDYDDLKQAKEYYDKSAKSGSSTEEGRDALQRSADIGKLETFGRNPLDSNATPEAIDEAAYTQFLLSEVYWFALNKPDTAILEMQYLIDSFPSSYDAPGAMISLSAMYREFYEDDQAADSILKEMLTRYPQSDFVPGALDQLGLRGTAADTGYAFASFSKAENFLVDDDQADSALLYFQRVVDEFPDSKYNLQARFNLIWLTENYFSPGDSSVIFAYEAYADSFPESELARTASRRVRFVPKQTTPVLAAIDDESPGGERNDTLLAARGGTEADTVRSVYIDPLLALYYRPNGDSLVSLKERPIEVLEPFEFPAEEAASVQNDWILYFQILVDFSGRVVDYALKIPSGIYEIDERAKLAVESMTFNALDVTNRVISSQLRESPDGQGYWFVYEYRVEKPEYMR